MTTGKPDFRKPVPEGVVEHLGFGTGEGGLVDLGDGSLMLLCGKGRYYSADGGRSWSEPRPFHCEAMDSPAGLSCIMLQSGELALAHRGRETTGQGTEEFNWNPFYLSRSADGGETWSGAAPMNILGGP